MAVIELPQTAALKAAHCQIRNHSVDYPTFVGQSNRIIRMVLEKCFEQVPYQNAECSTPIGEIYAGKKPSLPICAVSVIRAGESMEQEFKQICPYSPIGKILIQRDKTTKQPKFFFESLPDDIHERFVLILEPMIATGGSALAVIERLTAQGVREANICFASILTSPQGCQRIQSLYPSINIVTSAMDKQLNEQAFMVPGIGDFGDRYFGTVKLGAENGQQ